VTDKTPEGVQKSARQRNLLAVQRTQLAGERTFLAYLRTALAFAGVGLTLLKFFADEVFFVVLGWVFIPLGLLLVVVGFQRNRKAHRISKELCEQDPVEARELLGFTDDTEDE
jgi:putative membrane protein